MRLPFLVFLSLAPGFLLAQTTSEAGPIRTVRPRLTDTSTIISRGRFQIEAGIGLGFGGDKFTRRNDYGEVLFRYGIAPRWEIRIEAPSYIHYRNLHSILPGSFDGYTDPSLAASYLLGHVGSAQLAVRPRVTIPIHDQGGTNLDEVSPSVAFTGELPLANGWSFASTVGYSHQSISDRHPFIDLGIERRLDLYHASFVAERALGRRASVFAEFAGLYLNGSVPSQSTNYGARLRLTNQSQIDVRVTIPIDDRFVQNIFGAGYSIRL